MKAWNQTTIWTGAIFLVLASFLMGYKCSRVGVEGFYAPLFDDAGNIMPGLSEYAASCEGEQCAADFVMSCSAETGMDEEACEEEWGAALEGVETSPMMRQCLSEVTGGGKPRDTARRICEKRGII
nr:hypothetical protein TetV2_00381 [Oceanusvirus sp.]